ncbi:hypothetical protein Mic7113_0687 [Allocoleopsis franciscana PCC 7113]|uniref:Uncharacterized protein n=1 Tax=Allocoleopsis franciscana PCC 7113 TaxID=1173027 RepID=K9W8A7_9CYAN|nr:hypothetical protein Mic7113_0687 [Allocoleopsis franciscana PCC 7113]
MNVPGDFTATTATRIGFGNNNGFNAVGTNDYSALIETPSTFAFGTSGAPGAIINTGQLAVSEGKNLTLLGGTVLSTGELKAPGGNLSIAAVPGQNLIRISLSGHLLNLEIQPCGSSTNCTLPATSNALLPTPLSLPQLLTGNAGSPAKGLTVNDVGQVVLTDSGLVVPQSPGTLVLSGTADASTTKQSDIGGSVQLRGNLVGLVEKAQERDVSRKAVALPKGIEAAGCQIVYLPPYSPDLNRIEKCWAWLKSRIRKRLPQSASLRDAIESVLKQAAS